MKRINELDENGSVDLDSYLGNDKVGWGEALKFKIQTLYNYIATQFGLADTAIKNGAGLNSNGTLTPTGVNYLTGGAFAAAGLTVTLNNADKLLDAQIKALANQVGGASSTTFVIRKVQHGNQKFLYTNPIAIIGAPGAAKTTNIMKAVAWLDYSGGALNCGASDLKLRYKDTGTLIGSFTNAFLEAGEDKYQFIKFEDNVFLSANEAIEVFTDADDSGGTSTSDIYIALFYNVINWEVFDLVTPGGLGM